VVANEGIRISSLVDDIQKQQLTPEQQVLRDELLNMEPLHPLEAAEKANRDAQEKPHDIPSQPVADTQFPYTQAPHTSTPHLTSAGANCGRDCGRNVDDSHAGHRPIRRTHSP
jgi:hypothetical protein